MIEEAEKRSKINDWFHRGGPVPGVDRQAFSAVEAGKRCRDGGIAWPKLLRNLLRRNDATSWWIIAENW
jgi:hypothetical protein